ncbi:TPA: hypothetical protein DF272_04570 [Candidatus Falkowbacteria bacterium]|nr:hypothetical protein [Candidatus Falkowbacteria bacterium]
MHWMAAINHRIRTIIDSATDSVMGQIQAFSDKHQRQTKSLAAQIKKLQKTLDTGTSTGQLQAQSLSCMISNRTRCNAGCLGCISRTTPGCSQLSTDIVELDIHRLNVGLDFASRCGATSAILTGKADPLQERPTYLTKLIRTCRAKMPEVDIHTNGFLLGKRHQLKNLVNAGLTMITFSIASFNPDENTAFMGENARHMDYHRLIAEARALGLKVRCSLLLTKISVNGLNGVIDYIRTAKEYGAHQIVIRELWVSDVEAEHQSETWYWNQANKISLDPLIKEFWRCHRRGHQHGIKYIWPLPWGAPIFDVFGMNVTFARCEESLNGATLKSIVHKIDGHGYRDWDHEGSILY